MTGYTGAAQMRKHAGASTGHDFTVEFPSPTTNGQIILSMSATTTSAIKAGRYVYDIVITLGDSNKQTVVEGNVLVREGVTR